MFFSLGINEVSVAIPVQLQSKEPGKKNLTHQTKLLALPYLTCVGPKIVIVKANPSFWENESNGL